jgi:YD repeat-containing protein
VDLFWNFRELFAAFAACRRQFSSLGGDPRPTPVLAQPNLMSLQLGERMNTPQALYQNDTSSFVSTCKSRAPRCSGQLQSYFQNVGKALTFYFALMSGVWAQVAVPQFQPASGTSATSISVTVTDSTSGSQIYYSLDGSIPTTSSPTVTSGQSVAIPGSCTLKAVAYQASTASAMASGVYQVTGAISAGDYHVATLKSDGTAWVWGDNSANQIPGSSATFSWIPVQAALSGQASAVSAGGYHTLVLMQNGTVEAFGRNVEGELGNGGTGVGPVAVSGLTNVKAVAAGGYHSLALMTDGTVRAWGMNGNGQLGEGDTTSQSTPVTVSGLSNVVAIAAGMYSSYALKSDGTIWSWGANSSYQLGDGSGVDQDLPVQVPGLTGMTAIAAGWQHAAALKSDGTVWSWGYAFDGEMGDGTIYWGANPTPTEAENIGDATAIACGANHTVIIRSNGAMWTWGGNSCGQLANGEVWISTLIADPQASILTSNIVAVAAGGYTTFALHANGDVSAFGYEEFGQLGGGQNMGEPIPIQTYASQGAKSVAAGLFCSSIAEADGTAGWMGDFETEDLYIGGQDPNDESYQLQIPSGGPTNIVQIAMGDNHTLALCSDGTVWAWGVGYDGELGDGNYDANMTPAQISGLSNIVWVSAGGESSLAVDSSGNVYTWGADGSGQLGDGSTNDETSPLQVSGITGVVEAFMGQDHVLAIKQDGTAWVWGANDQEQLLPTATTPIASPTQVSGVSTAVSGAAGDGFSFVLNADGSVMSWGVNDYGELGQGDTEYRSSPTTIPGLADVAALSAGYYHALALLTNGTVEAWGYNYLGEIGDGTYVDKHSPIPVVGLTDVQSISAGYLHSLAVKNDGSAWGWGNNGNEQIGVTERRENRAVLRLIPNAGDTDGNGIPDAWELQHLGSLNHSGGTDDDQDGLSEMQEYLYGSDPTKANTAGGPFTDIANPIYYGSIAATAELSTVSGNAQSGPPSTFLPQPIVVQVQDGSGNVIPGAPVSVCVSSGGGLLTTNTGSGNLFSKVAVNADSNGNVTVYYQQGAIANITSTIAFASGSASLDINATTTANTKPQITSQGVVNGAVSLPLTYAISATQSPTSYSATGLPPGLSLNDTTGAITGTPTTAGVFSVSLSATNASGTGTGALVFSITQSTAAPVINSSASLLGSAGMPISYQIAATNNPVLFGASNLPAGLSINSATGAISGMVASSGSYNISLSASNGAGTGTQTLTLAINSGTGGGSMAPVITSSLSDSGTAGDPFEFDIMASNSPTSFGATGLPDGLSVDPSTGVISGTPTNGGTYSVLISAANASGTTSSYLNLTLGYTTPAISSATSATATVGTAFSYSIVATNLPTSYSTSSLPAGLTLDSTGGVISGTPTTVGTYSITLNATNGTGTGTTTLALTIAPQGPPTVTSEPVAYATVNQPFSFTVTAAGNPTSFGATNLPSGLSINTATGVISGTLTSVGTPNVTVAANNTLGQGTSTLVIAVQAASGSVSATTTLQDGVSPSSAYTTTSAGIVTDSSTASAATAPSGQLLVGTSSYTAENRVLLGFDLSAIPPGATITGASLTLQENSTPYTSFNVELHQAASFVPATADWTSNSSYNSDVLSTFAVSSSTPAATWVTSTDFVSAIQGTLSSGDMLDLMLVSPDAEASGTQEDLSLTSENVSVVADRPNLTINYTTSAPPVMIGGAVPVPSQSSFNYQVVAVNGAASYSATGLPGGLSINSSTGLISGTANTNGTYNVAISATNANGTGTSGYVFTVGTSNSSLPPAITSPAIAYATVGTAFNFTATASNGPVTFAASDLPSGFSIDSSTGAITGTPTSSEIGTPNVTLTASNANGSATATLILVVQSSSNSISVTVPLQDGVTPDPDYQTTSMGIATDTSNSTTAQTADGPLMVGRLTADQINRGILGFDLSVIPAGATITSASLVLNAEATGTTSNTTDYGVEVHASTASFSQLTDLETANWSEDNGYNSAVLSSLSTTIPTTATSETWASTSAFVSAVQGAFNGGTPLFLTVVSPTLESGSAIDYFLFDNETANYAPPTASTRPILLVTYTTSAPPVIAPTSASGAPGSAFSYQVSSLNGATSYSASGLPSGLTINSSTGVISGTPTSGGTYVVTITASNGNGTGTSNLTLNFGSAPSITSSLAVNATVGSSFNYTITASNTSGLTGITYSASDLPAGLALDSTTGVISGTPATGDTNTTATIEVQTVFGAANENLAFTFAPTPYETGPYSAAGNTNDSFSYSLDFDNSPTSVTATNLPAGLSIDNYGNITGTPTAVTSADGVQVSITASNAAGSTTIPVSLTIIPLPLPVITTQPQTGIIGDGIYDYVQISIPTAANAGYIYASNITATGLPGGLIIDPNYGTISGTPTDSISDTTNYSVSISATDGAGTATGNATITLFPPGPGISSSLVANTDVGENFYYELTTIEYDSTSTSATGLPPGLTYTDYGTYGEISGNPTTPGVYDVTLSATDANGINTATLVVTVGSLTSPSTATAQVGVPFTFAVTDNNSPTAFQATNLPAGTTSNPFTINPTTGVITGTPVTAETVPVTVSVTDASGTASQVLTLTVDPASSDSLAQFQQGVSPTSTYTTPSATITTDSNDADTANQTFDSGQLLSVGETTATASSRALLGFDLSSLPANATITSAELVMATSSGNSSGSPVYLEVHQSYVPLDAANSNWNNNSDYNPTLLSSTTIDPAAAPGNNTFTVSPAFTQAAQQAYNSTEKFYLTVLAPDVEGSGTPDYLGFVTNATTPAQNPELIVTYTVSAPTAPVITSSGTATGTVNQSFTYAITATNNPQQFAATGLPSGLTLNTSTGVISGTVTTVSSTLATVTASNSAGSGSQNVTFNIDTATPATTLQVSSGNNQLGVPGAVLAQPLIVEALQNGSPLANSLVTFSTALGGGAFSTTNTGNPPTASTLTALTNGSGLATVYFGLPQTIQTTTVVVTAGTAAPVNLLETAAPLTSSSGDSLALLSVLSGEGQSGPAGVTLAAPFVVQAANVSGQPLASQSLTLTVQAGSGGISTSSGSGFASSLTVSTDNTGKATVYMQPGGSNGTDNKVSVAATSGATPVFLTAETAATSTASAPTPGGGSAPTTDLDPTVWSGYAYIVEADEDNGNYVDGDDEDPTSINIHWESYTGTGVTGFLVEKKVSTGQWSTLANAGAGETYVEDSGLRANQEVQYRVTPVMTGGNLGSPSSPVSYDVPILKTMAVQTSSAGSWKGYVSEEQFPASSAPYYPTVPTYYLNNLYNAFTSGGYSGDDSSSGDEGSYMYSTTYVPTPNPKQGELNVNYIYGGSSQYSSWGSDEYSSYSNNASSSANAQGVWTGSFSDSSSDGGSYSGSDNGPVWDWWWGNQLSQSPTSYTWGFNNSGDNSWSFGSSSETLSNEYSTQQFEQDVNNSLPDYSAWNNNYYGWGWYGGGYWGWDDYGWDGWWLASRYLDSSEADYSINCAQYKFTAYACNNYNFQWAIVFVKQDNSPNPAPEEQRTSIQEVKSWNISGSSTSTSSPYELNPLNYGDQLGDYYIAPVPQLYVSDGSQSYLDTQEMEQTGTQVSEVTDPSQNSFNFDGEGSFDISGSGIPGTEYKISWSGSGDSSFQVWGYNYTDDQWEQVTNGQQIELDYEDDDGDLQDEWSGEFEVVATQDTQNGDSINLTMSSKGPDETQLGSSSSLFTYTKPTPDLSVPIDEASGSRYRKIALNGLPMADEKPQQSAENTQEKEETYVDALTLGLRHSTTDAYLPVSGSDFSVSARRDFRSEVFNNGSGLLPHEQPDLPFGVCWSSNLAPNIKFSMNYDPTNTTPPQATVTDETGAVHSFFLWTDGSGNTQFFPMPTAKNEAQVPNLESLTVNSSVYPPVYTFTRKYGATLTYQSVPSLYEYISNNRLIGANYSTYYTYARLVQATDRVGNTINYQFQSSVSLIPATITVANQPGIKLSIEQTQVSSLPNVTSSSTQSVITAIWDANGNKTTYSYANAPGDTLAVALVGVTTPDGATTQYSYSTAVENDLTPAPANSAVAKYSYTDIASITDPLGHTYAFTYAMDHSKNNYMNNPQLPYTGYYIQSGSPRNIASVTMPDNTSSHPDVATFVNNSAVFITPQMTAGGQRADEVTDATGFTRTYTFGGAVVVPLPQFPQSYYSSNVSESKIFAYTSMTIGEGTYGSESFQFDLNASMALSSATDLSGNTTTYNHETTANEWTAPPSYAGIASYISGVSLNGYYDDPVSQTNAINGVKTFAYDTGSRVMTDSTDENGNHTHYDLDSLGRRTTEKIYDPNNHLVQETDFAYGNSTYPGFMTQKTVKALGGSDPSWMGQMSPNGGSLITQYTPDSNGRVAHETADPGGLNLVTTYSYDANGNKLTSIDPKGQTTWFSYDSRNRLVTTTFPDGSQQQFVYDSRGNKTVEYDENGIATLFQYDSLSRLVTQARDMNGNGRVDPNTDLVTSNTYNNANSKVTTTDPNGGVTTNSYDTLQRVTSISDALHYVTQFTYGANSGGDAFDSSSFKPTHTVDPRGYATNVTYDGLYRPVTKAVQYSQSSAPATTTTTYDAVGNPLDVTDPLGHQTRTTFDALNRPLTTTYADASTMQQAYTSTGFKWQVIDGNSNVTRTVFDAEGRPTSVTEVA